MPSYVIGARGHDYGRATPQQLFSRIKADGYQAVQLAYLKAIEGVRSYADVTPARVAETKQAAEQAGVALAVLGTYVELSHLEDAVFDAQVEAFISQIPVCKALGAGCIASETTAMRKQPAGATKQQAQKRLMRALERILPVAEREDVVVALEPVWHHALDTTQTVKRIADAMRSKHLKFLFDPANLLSQEWITRQDALFQEAMQVWGEDVVAVHFKGVCYDARQTRTPCPLEQSIVDYRAAFRAMDALKQPSLAVLREEAVPAQAAKEIAFMQSFL